MSEKILIIDNNPDMVTLLNMLIREMTPYEPVITNNPLEALELVRKDGFVLVITEMELPLLDGLELLDAVKRIDEDIQVIIISAYGALESALEAMRRGAFAYITKPFRKEQILFSIENAFNLTRLEKEIKMLKERLKNSEQLLSTIH